ncbi:MAG: hypothetical protein ABI867_11605 [Kofleriaceae bacterium]
MGEPPCDLITAEHALDRLEAELATELPAHVRAFAAAYAADTASPPAPAIARRPGSLVQARRGLEHPLLADRALALVRLLAPLAIEDDPAVAAARDGERTWANYDRLMAARDRAAGTSAIELLQHLHGASAVAAPSEWPAVIAGWSEPCEPIANVFVERAWRDLAMLHGLRGTCRIVRAEVRPRAFIVEPGREVIVVIGAVATPVARFTALHELGHAVAALAVPGVLPRVVDEAAAAYIARALEVEGALDLAWFTPLAGAARDRRRQLAAALAAVEQGGPRGPLAHPPWALWYDPGAQAAYGAAEAIAERWWTTLGASPDPGAFARVLAEERAAIDRIIGALPGTRA